MDNNQTTPRPQNTNIPLENKQEPASAAFSQNQQYTHPHYQRPVIPNHSPQFQNPSRSTPPPAQPTPSRYTDSTIQEQWAAQHPQTVSYQNVQQQTQPVQQQPMQQQPIPPGTAQAPSNNPHQSFPQEENQPGATQTPHMQTATTERTGDLPNNPQVIFSWKAPLRAYKKSGSKVLRFYIVLALLLCIIVYFFGDIILIIPILAVLFLFYVLTVTPPPIVDNKITQFGIETAGVNIRWELLSHFYYTNRFGFHVLTLVGHGPYYLHSFIIVPTNEIREVITQILSQHVMYQESPKRTLTDKLIDWLSHLVPDEDEEEHKAEEKKRQENAKQELPKRPVWSLFTFLQGLRKGKKTSVST